MMVADIAIATSPAAMPSKTISPSFSSNPKPKMKIAKAGAVLVPGIGKAILQAKRITISPTRGRATEDCVKKLKRGLENLSSSLAKDTSFPMAPENLLGSKSFFSRN
jgi:hypothetical protein